jgi:hypothetical protein
MKDEESAASQGLSSSDDWLTMRKGGGVYPGIFLFLKQPLLEGIKELKNNVLRSFSG